MNDQKGLATVWIVLIVVVLAGLVGVAVYGIRKNLAQKEMVEEELEEAIEQGAEQLAEETEEETVSGLISQFESFQEDQQANRVLSLMTNPEGSSEESEYQSFWVMPDDPSAGYRLYSANELSYKVKSHAVDQINKISESQYQAKVIEKRDSNWSQMTADWTVKNGEYQVVFTVVKQDNSWLVDKYQTANKEGKYSAFYITSF